jgi:mycothiol synthase
VIGRASPATPRSEGVRTRPPRLEDAPRVAALVTAATSGWLGWAEATEETILGWWRSPGVHLEHESRVAVTAEELTGYAFLLPGERFRSTIWLELWIREGADESMIGDALLTGLEPRLTMLARRATPAAPVRLRLQVEASRRAVGEMLERRGFEIVRSPIRMVADLDRGLPRPSWPDGVRVRTFVPADARSVHTFQMEALRDTWEFEPESFETWMAETEAPRFDPSLWWIAEREGELVGVMLCRMDSSDPELGWLHVIGVGRPWRRRALGQALLLHALHEFRARGLRRAALGVDADNPTGARRLAERNGFQVAQRFWTYERRLRGSQPLRRILRGVRRTVRARSSR